MSSLLIATPYKAYRLIGIKRDTNTNIAVIEILAPTAYFLSAKLKRLSIFWGNWLFMAQKFWNRKAIFEIFTPVALSDRPCAKKLNIKVDPDTTGYRLASQSSEYLMPYMFGGVQSVVKWNPGCTKEDSNNILQAVANQTSNELQRLVRYINKLTADTQTAVNAATNFRDDDTEAEILTKVRSSFPTSPLKLDPTSALHDAVRIYYTIANIQTYYTQEYPTAIKNEVDSVILALDISITATNKISRNQFVEAIRTTRVNIATAKTALDAMPRGSLRGGLRLVPVPLTQQVGSNTPLFATNLTTVSSP